MPRSPPASSPPRSATMQPATPLTAILCGAPGTGKSTLINAVFSPHHPTPLHTPAATRAGGVPCTQHVRVHGPSLSLPIRLLDTRGLERASYVAQRDALLALLATPRKRDAVHHAVPSPDVLLYALDDRWTDGDADVVRSARSAGAPVALVATRADGGARADLDAVTGAPSVLRVALAAVRACDDTLDEREQSDAYNDGWGGIENGMCVEQMSSRDLETERTAMSIPSPPVFVVGNAHLAVEARGNTSRTNVPAPLEAPPNTCPHGHASTFFIVSRARREWTCMHDGTDAATPCGSKGALQHARPYGIDALVAALTRAAPAAARRRAIIARATALRDARARVRSLCVRALWEAVWNRVHAEKLATFALNVAWRAISAYTKDRDEKQTDIIKDVGESVVKRAAFACLAQARADGPLANSARWAGGAVATHVESFSCGLAAQTVAMGCAVGVEAILWPKTAFGGECAGAKVEADSVVERVSSASVGDLMLQFCEQCSVNDMDETRREWARCMHSVNDAVRTAVVMAARDVERELAHE